MGNQEFENMQKVGRKYRCPLVCVSVIGCYFQVQGKNQIGSDTYRVC